MAAFVVAFAATLFAAIPAGPATADSEVCDGELLPSKLTATPEWKDGAAALDIEYRSAIEGSRWDTFDTTGGFAPTKWHSVLQVKKSTDEWNARTGDDDYPDGIGYFEDFWMTHVDWERQPLTGFEPSTSYDVRAYSKCQDGDEWVLSQGVTETLTVTTLGGPKPDPVLNVRVKVSQPKDDGSRNVTIRWKPPETGPSFRRHRVRLEGFGVGDGDTRYVEKTRRPGPKKTSLVFKGIEDDMSCWFEISTRNDEGFSEPVNIYVDIRDGEVEVRSDDGTSEGAKGWIRIGSDDGE